MSQTETDIMHLRVQLNSTRNQISAELQQAFRNVKKAEMSYTVQTAFENSGRLVQQVGKADAAWIRLEGQIQTELKIRERVKTKKYNFVYGSYCKDCVDRTVAEFGSLDILVNNAGFQKNQESIDDIDAEQLERTFRTNFFGLFYLAKAAVARMKKGSCIINTGSITGLEGEKTLLDYSATKGAIHAFTKSLAQNLVEKGIRVNAVAPGPVWTPLNVQSSDPNHVKEFGQDTGMERPGQPEELAPAYVFLASNIDSSYISGEILPVLGGDTIAG